MSLDIKAGLRRPKIDMHTHIWAMDQGEEISSAHLVKCAEMLGITEVWASSPITSPVHSMEAVRQQNDCILRAMERHPDRVRGMCYLIAGYFNETVAEMKRCLDAGMVGVKLYNQYKIQDPAVWPILELAIERNVPVLEHAGYVTDPSGKAAQPLLSHGADFAAASKRYPEATLIHAHIGGGGDWVWTIRALRDASPNVYVDVSGSVLDDGQVEMAVAELGAERVLFGTDGTMAGAVGKVLGAKISEEERELIFWGNAARLLAAQGKTPIQPRDAVGGGMGL